MGGFPVMACTIYDDSGTVFSAIEAGASGYIIKSGVAVTRIFRKYLSVLSKQFERFVQIQTWFISPEKESNSGLCMTWEEKR
ncbi:MAG: hypothetical protein DRP87_19440 [Spirochaetes bacterium]|nr:MAG: hypothetical protein DRP87_19440 [Spirochaetota bacterium]